MANNKITIIVNTKVQRIIMIMAIMIIIITKK